MSRNKSKHSRSKSRSIFRTFLPFGLTAAALWIVLSHDPALLHWNMAWPKLLRPLLRMLGYLGIGLAVGLIVEGMGWAPLLARAVRPLMQFGNLKDESGAAFTTAFLSGTAANSMLMSFWRDGKLTEQEMRLSYLVNTGLPVFLLHLPTTFFIVVPIVGKAGAIYLALNGVAALMRTITVLGWTRARLQHRNRPATVMASQTEANVKSETKDTSNTTNAIGATNTTGTTGTTGTTDATGATGTTDTTATVTPQNTGASANQPQTGKTGKTSLSMERVASLFRRRFTRIITITAPIYFLMYALTQAGLFEAMRQLAATWISTGILPVEAASVVIFAVASEFTSGIAAAGALLDAGTLTTQQTVLALILGTIAATPIRAIRHQLPSHAGIFTPALGLIMLLQSQALRIGSLALVTWCWLMLQ